MVRSVWKEDIEGAGGGEANSGGAGSGRNVVVSVGPPYTQSAKSGDADVELAERASQGNVQKADEEEIGDGERGAGGAGGAGSADGGTGLGGGGAPVAEYKVYKRRWFGLVQLTLLNIIVSWDVSRRGEARAGKKGEQECYYLGILRRYQLLTLLFSGSRTPPSRPTPPPSSTPTRPPSTGSAPPSSFPLSS